MPPAIWANVAEFPPADAAHGEWASWTGWFCRLEYPECHQLQSEIPYLPMFWGVKSGNHAGKPVTPTSSCGSLNNLSLTNLRKKGQGSLNQVGVHLDSDHSWSVTCLVGCCSIYCYVSPSPRRCS